MKIQPINIALAGVNLLLLLFLLSRVGPAAAQGNASVLRGSALELVDAQGQVRTRINVEPGGEVVLRLLDQEGTIRVKLGASTDGSGLVLLNDATEPGVQILANSTGSSIKLIDKGGQEKLITP